MAGSNKRAPRHRARVQATVEEAESGDLPKIGEFNVQGDMERGHKIGIAAILIRNSAAEQGTTHEVYGDLRDGYAVVDLDPVEDDE